MKLYRPVLGALVAAASLPVYAQIKLPQPSPGTTLVHDLGVAKVTLTYHRPAVKGRKVWGELVPYGEVWRLGANEATTIEVTDGVTLAGHDLAAGTYALFAVPGKERWTLVVNRNPKQWGSYFRKKEDDLFRFEVTPEIGPMTEWMTFTMTPVARDTLRVDFAWETLRFSFPIFTDVVKRTWKDVDAALASAKPDDWAVWLTAAQWARAEKTRLDEALVWIDRSLAIKQGFWNNETKGRLLDDLGRTKEAIPYVEKARELAKPAAPQAYVDGLDKTLAEWRTKVGK